MYCRHCGKPNKDGAKFCVGCGKLIMVKAPTAPTPVQKQLTPRKKKSIIPVIFAAIMLVMIIALGVFGGIKIFNDKKASSNESLVAESSASPLEKSTNDSLASDNDTLTPSVVNTDVDSSGNNSDADKSADSNQTDFKDTTFIKEITPVSAAYADDHRYYGNSFENISQGGTMLSYGDWIYYSNANVDSTVWKMKADGSEQTQVLDVAAWHISIQNDWMYYREYESGHLCRFNLLDETKETLVARKVYEPKVVGHYIYYEDESNDSFDLYRIDIDGSNEVKLTDGIILYCVVTDKRIYYLDTAVDRKGYSVDLDGNDKQLWYAGRVGTIDYYDGVLYFTDADKGGLYSLDPNTNDIKQISKLTMWSINVYNGWVYYADGNADGVLARTSLDDPNSKETLGEHPCELVNVSGGWVQYHVRGLEESEGFYWIPIDGGSAKQF